MYEPEETIRIDVDPTTGRSSENVDDVMCDHCDEQSWSVLLEFTGEFMRTRRLCPNCTGEVLEWI